MFKFLLGFIIGCFFTFNYIMPNEEYKLLLERANIYTLELLEDITNHLKNNVENY